MKQNERSTFSRTIEVVEHGIDYLKRVRDVLSSLRDGEHPERVTMLLDSFELEHRNLLGAIERYREDADDRLLQTYAQYTVLLPVEMSEPDRPLTTLSLMTWLQRLNQPLASMFRELAETAKTPDLREAFAALADQVESHERKLSKEYQRLEDL